MENWNDLFNYENLAFYGKVNASISHELKNIMAIISETAGLLSDLSEMAKEGKPVDADLLISSTDSIIEEIQRGFTTIRQMNRFAHSVDTPVADVDLMGILDLVRNLSGYLSFTGNAHLHSSDRDVPVVQTCPFILQAIIYRTMVQAFQNVGPGAELDISIERRNDSAWGVLFHGFSISEFEVFPDASTKRLSASIGVSIHWDRAADRLVINIPISLTSEAAQVVSPKRRILETPCETDFKTEDSSF